MDSFNSLLNWPLFGCSPFKFTCHTRNGIHILFQKTDVIDTVMPSKLLGMMASAKPSIVTGNLKSEVATIFNDSQGGYYFDGNSVNDIINNIKKLTENKELCKTLGLNAKTYVNEKFSKKEVLDKFINKLLMI